MWFKKHRQIEPLLDPVIDKILEELAQNGTETPEYKANLEHLQMVTQIRNSVPKHRVSPDTLVLAGVQLFGILIIVAFEQRNVITSKALSFIPKLK